MAFHCLLCGSSDTPTLVSETLRDENVGRTVVRCPKCTHVQLSPLPTQEEDTAFYGEDKQLTNLMTDAEYGQLWERDKVDTERRAAWITKNFPPKGLVLDVGCGYGFFVDAMVKAGFPSEGIDVGKASIDIAKAHGKNTYMQGLVDADFAKKHAGRYGMVASFHVLEHLLDPVAFLTHCKTLVKPGGTLIIEVPNGDDSLLNYCDPYRAFYWQRAHLSYFGVATLKDAFRRAGLKEPTMHGVQRYGLQNLMNWITEGKPQLRKPVYGADLPLLKPVEEFYRSQREKALTSDTIIAVVGIG